MNPRRRRRLRNQRKQRQRLHHKIWEAVHAAERSRRAQAQKKSREAEKRLGPGHQVIPAYVFENQNAAIERALATELSHMSPERREQFRKDWMR